MTTPKPAPMTTQRLHALLRKLGYVASKNQGASRIRGLPNRSAGYHLSRSGNDDIRITWYGRDYTTPVGVIAEKVGKIHVSLTEAGIACMRVGDTEIVIEGEERRHE
jgi:hypothetical protein